MTKISEAQRSAQRMTSSTSQDGNEPDVHRLSMRGAPLYEIDQLLDVAGHELRTPLTPLKLRLQQTRRRLQREGGRERDVSDLAKALYHVERVQQQIALFLDATSLAYGSLSLAPRLCELNEVARRLTDIYASANTDRSIRLEERGDPLSGVWDSARLDVALRELLSNALKYTTGAVTLRIFRQGSFARVEAEDDGPAIPPRLRERIFEPFATGQHSNHGLGLGLYVAREIIRLHGGEMGVREGASGGAIFWFTLPLS